MNSDPTPPDWRNGTGYPDASARPALWEAEFYRRGVGKFPKPYFFRPEDGFLEVLSGPGFIQVNSDGTASIDGLLPPQRHMVLLFFVDQDIDDQLEQARRVLMGNQSVRFVRKKRQRADKYRLYLRALDAESAGATEGEIGAALFPKLDDIYPQYERRTNVRRTLQLARKLVVRWETFVARVRK